MERVRLIDDDGEPLWVEAMVTPAGERPRLSDHPTGKVKHVYLSTGEVSEMPVRASSFVPMGQTSSGEELWVPVLEVHFYTTDAHGELADPGRSVAGQGQAYGPEGCRLNHFLLDLGGARF